jgi:hypothetical protein
MPHGNDDVRHTAILIAGVASVVPTPRQDTATYAAISVAGPDADFSSCQELLLGAAAPPAPVAIRPAPSSCFPISPTPRRHSRTSME